jgi:hypothetical protein
MTTDMRNIFILEGINGVPDSPGSIENFLTATTAMDPDDMTNMSAGMDQTTPLSDVGSN